MEKVKAKQDIKAKITVLFFNFSRFILRQTSLDQRMVKQFIHKSWFEHNVLYWTNRFQDDEVIKATVHQIRSVPSCCPSAPTLSVPLQPLKIEIPTPDSETRADFVSSFTPYSAVWSTITPRSPKCLKKHCPNRGTNAEQSQINFDAMKACCNNQLDECKENCSVSLINARTYTGRRHKTRC